MALTAAQIAAKKDILLMDVKDFLAFDPQKDYGFAASVHTRAKNALRDNLLDPNTGGYCPVVLILLRTPQEISPNHPSMPNWGEKTAALTSQKLQEHGLVYGQFSDQQSVDMLALPTGSTRTHYEDALDRYIARLKSLDAGQNPGQPTTAANADETVIKMSPRGLTMTFGDKVDPARIAEFQKALAALAAQHLGPSGDSDTAPAPTPPA